MSLAVKLNERVCIPVLSLRSFSSALKMRNYLDEFKGNIRLTDLFLRGIKQDLVKPVKPKGIFSVIWQNWPLCYITGWVIFYLYLIFGERAGLVNISEQIWCLMSVSQVLVKLLNRLMQSDKMTEILRWCEGLYTAKYKPEYRVIVFGVFEKTNSFIGLCIR